MHETVNVIVTIGEEYKDNLVPVTEELTKCGMSISQVMSNIGVVAGSIANENIHIVKQIQGVMQVEEDRAYQIARRQCYSIAFQIGGYVPVALRRRAPLFIARKKSILGFFCDEIRGGMSGRILQRTRIDR